MESFPEAPSSVSAVTPSSNEAQSFLDELNHHVKQTAYRYDHQECIEVGKGKEREWPMGTFASKGTWTPIEQKKFFYSLARQSRWRPDLIASDIGTRSEVEVASYISRLEYQKHRLDKGYDKWNENETTPQLEAAGEVSEEWINFEQSVADNLEETKRSSNDQEHPNDRILRWDQLLHLSEALSDEDASAERFDREMTDEDSIILKHLGPAAQIFNMNAMGRLLGALSSRNGRHFAINVLTIRWLYLLVRDYVTRIIRMLTLRRSALGQLHNRAEFEFLTEETYTMLQPSYRQSHQFLEYFNGPRQPLLKSYKPISLALGANISTFDPTADLTRCKKLNPPLDDTRTYVNWDAKFPVDPQNAAHIVKRDDLSYQLVSSALVGSQVQSQTCSSPLSPISKSSNHSESSSRHSSQNDSGTEDESRSEEESENSIEQDIPELSPGTKRQRPLDQYEPKEKRRRKADVEKNV